MYNIFMTKKKRVIFMIRIKLKEILKEKNMTQKELAERTDLRPNVLSEMANNSRTTINKEHLEIVMDELGIEDLSEILEYRK